MTEHPLLLASLLATILAAGAAAGAAPQLLRSLRRSALPVIGLSVLVNVLVSRQGLTVFARLGDWGVLGQVNLTLEALVYGAVFALRLLVVALACLLAVCAADPDELLGSCGRLSPRVALSATVALRMVPVLAGDAGRLAEAQRCRPGAGAGRSSARGRLAVLQGHGRRGARALPGCRRRARDARLPRLAAGAPDHPAPVPATTSPSRRRPRRSRCWRSCCCARRGRPLSRLPARERAAGPGGRRAGVPFPAIALAPFLDRAGIEP